MSSNVPVAEATRDEAVLPERVQEALGQLVGAAKEGLLSLSVAVGLGVLSSMMEEEVDEVVGPKGKWNRERTAVRHGHEDGEVTLGGRRVEVRRPRMRSAEGEHEVPLQTYEHFADRDPMSRVVLERMLAGVSTRRYRRTQEPVGEQVEVRARSTSKSAVSRTFVERTRTALAELMSRQLADLRLRLDEPRRARRERDRDADHALRRRRAIRRIVLLVGPAAPDDLSDRRNPLTALRLAGDLLEPRDDRRDPLRNRRAATADRKFDLRLPCS